MGSIAQMRPRCGPIAHRGATHKALQRNEMTS